MPPAGIGVRMAGDSGHDIITDFALGADRIGLADLSFGDEPGQISKSDFLASAASFDGVDMLLDLGVGRSIRLPGLIEDEDEQPETEALIDILA